MEYDIKQIAPDVWRVDVAGAVRIIRYRPSHLKRGGSAHSRRSNDGPDTLFCCLSRSYRIDRLRLPKASASAEHEQPGAALFRVGEVS